MQGSQNRDGWMSLEDDDLQTRNPPSRARFEETGFESALSYAQEELARLRVEVDEIAHIVEMGRAIEQKPSAGPRLVSGGILLALILLAYSTR